jgi:amino-acid N-acetyltransferase
MQIEPADAGDIDDIERLLRVHRLPCDGLRNAAVDLFVARDGGRIAATAGLEWHGPNALLRSVAVAPERQGQGLGAMMTRAALERAAAKGAAEIVLLTTTAAAFFTRLGFETITRDEVPAELQRSVEFTTACPASATVMRKRLEPAG